MTPQLESYLTVKQTMRKLGVSRNSVDYFRMRGVLETFQFQHLVLIPKADVERLQKVRKERLKKRKKPVTEE
jgi:hypothetical protein